MDLLARLRARAVDPDPGSPQVAPAEPPCPRCGEPNDRIIDPAGAWYVCTRCGQRTESREDG